MEGFKRRSAWRIALVSAILASLASPLAWWWAKAAAEETIVTLATDEAYRFLRQFETLSRNPSDVEKLRAQAAADAIVGGLLDVVEIYDSEGHQLAKAMTTNGTMVDLEFPRNRTIRHSQRTYESVKSPYSKLWVLRVSVPQRQSMHDPRSPVIGYLEGMRVMPQWQQAQILHNSLLMALLVGLASLVCGAMLYPVVVFLVADNARKTHEVLESHIGMMEALGRTIAKRDSDTGLHNYRVAWIAARIGEALGLHPIAMQSLIVGSFLHDVGKIAIPDAILLKPGRLTEEEMDIMRTHVIQGESIVADIGWLAGANAVVAGHHEEWNGSGYPRGLVGEAIPITARIFAVADVFDALCSERPYKKSMEFEAAMVILQRDTGSHFDPHIMAIFTPMAHSLYQRLANANENDIRFLMKERVRVYFGM